MKNTQAYLHVYVFIRTVTWSLTIFHVDFNSDISITSLLNSLLKRSFCLLLPLQNLKYFVKFWRSFSQTIFESLCLSCFIPHSWNSLFCIRYKMLARFKWNISRIILTLFRIHIWGKIFVFISHCSNTYYKRWGWVFMLIFMLFVCYIVKKWSSTKGKEGISGAACKES